MDPAPRPTPFQLIGDSDTAVCADGICAVPSATGAPADVLADDGAVPRDDAQG
jgi:hypothetical protein